MVFGIFRLLEEDDDLPMTQALDIPDTPVVNRHVTKLNNLPSTTIPESPDCSDKVCKSFELLMIFKKLMKDYFQEQKKIIKSVHKILLRKVILVRIILILYC